MILPQNQNLTILHLNLEVESFYLNLAKKLYNYYFPNIKKIVVLKIF